MSDVPPRIRELLDRQPWEDITPRLVAYTLRKTRRLYWQGIRDGDMPEGKEAQDIVQDAIDDLFSGKRAWDPDSYPDLFAHLQSVIDSKVSAFVRSRANRRLRSEAVLSAAATLDDDEPSLLDTMTSPKPGPEEIALEEEEERRSEDFAVSTLCSLDDDPEAQKVLEAIFEGLTKRADIATRAGISVKSVSNIKKRLQRRLEDLRSPLGAQASRA